VLDGTWNDARGVPNMLQQATRTPAQISPAFDNGAPYYTIKIP
jgi:hypothetical protein